MIARSLRGALFNWERDEEGRHRRGMWAQAYTGEMYWPLDPLPEEIHFDDLVIGLSREPRYRGQTREFYSVAEHSFYVSLMAGQLARERNYPEHVAQLAERYGLLHDASEAWIGDVARPLKRQRVMWGYRRLEAKWERAVCERFDVHPTPLVQEIVKEVDNRIVIDEVSALMIDPDMWMRMNRYPGLESLAIDIMAMTQLQALDAFTQRFAELFQDWPDITFARDYVRKFRGMA